MPVQLPAQDNRKVHNMNLKQKFKIFISTALIISAVQVNAEEKSLEARVSELEAHNYLNYFSFGGLLETRYDSIKTDRKANAALGQSAIDASTQFLRLKSSLDLSANISDKIKFYSRYTGSKFFNTLNSTGGGQLILNEAFQGRDFTGAQIYIEKAYADYTFFQNENSSSVFSFGRLPTSDGPPINMINGRPRQGTFALLAYNSNFDGFGLSYNQKIDSTQSVSARFLYTPLSAVYRGTATGTGAYLTPYTSTNNLKVNNLTDIDSLILEYSNKDIKFAENFSLIYHGFLTGNFGFADRQLNSAAGANLYTGITESSIELHSLTATMDNIANMNIDFGFSVTSTKIKNSGVLTSSNPAAAPTVYGVAARTQGETVNGSEVLGNVKYRFNNKYALGAEYLTNNNAYSSAFTNDDLTQYYRTQGSAYQIYALVKPESELTLRFGYAHQDWDRTTQTLGPSNDTDQNIDTYYTNVRLDF